ncbi:VOC family protein [Microlunatus speluncae]|uniref:VOC family protein n=1 Tax=Microlunatus speluncae TaxID=2594267 RepID=UPI0012663850|nr:VOC family protein [Microlunatus speluncae]
MDTSTVAGLSLIMATNDDVARAAAFLGALGLEVAGDDGFVEVKGPSINLTIMRGAMVDVPPLGGLLFQVAVADVDAAAKLAADNGGEVVLGPMTTDWGSYSAYVRGPAGLTVELITPTAG